MEIIIPEEEILMAFEDALENEMNELIAEINQLKNETWIPLVKISTETCMNIKKMERTIEDENFSKEDYTLILTFYFRDNKAQSLGYRYNFILKQMIKENSNISKISDFTMIQKMLYHHNTKGDRREKSEAEFTILIRRNGY